MNFTAGAWNLNVSALYQGERERADGSPDNRVSLPAVIEMNTNLRYTFDDWTLQLQVLNFLDRKNETPPQSLGTEQNIPGGGREVRIGVEYAF